MQPVNFGSHMQSQPRGRLTPWLHLRLQVEPPVLPVALVDVLEERAPPLLAVVGLVLHGLLVLLVVLLRYVLPLEIPGERLSGSLKTIDFGDLKPLDK